MFMGGGRILSSNGIPILACINHMDAAYMSGYQFCYIHLQYYIHIYIFIYIYLTRYKLS